MQKKKFYEPECLLKIEDNNKIIRKIDKIPKLIAKNVLPLNMVQEFFTKEIHIRMHEGSAKKEMLYDIKKLSQMHSGDTALILCLTSSNGEIAFVEATKKYNVKVTPELMKGIKDIAGEECLHFKAIKEVPQPKARHWENR